MKSFLKHISHYYRNQIVANIAESGALALQLFCSTRIYFPIPIREIEPRKAYN